MTEHFSLRYAMTNGTRVPHRILLGCMVAGLAYYMALKYQPDRIALLKPLYEEEFQRAANEDVEKASYSIVPRQTWIN